MRKKKAESRITNDSKMHVRCTRNTMDPMVNTTLTPIFGKRRCICFNVLQSFQDLADIVTAIKTHGSVKVIMNPAGGNIVVRMSHVQRHGQHIHYPDFHRDRTRVAW